jgi:circadian clock protein KaiC
MCSEEIRPKRILIDSLTHFRRITQDESRLREIVIKFIHGLAKRGYTSFLTREVQGSDGPIAFEEYAVDASIRLHNEPLSGVGGNKRSIEVRKTRGHSHVSGKHPMFFESDGLAIYPHRKPEPSGPPDPSRLKVSRMASGVEGLDDLLHGGYVEGSCVLLAGAAGSGKTTLGLQFLRAGLEQEEPGVLVVFNESPQRVAQRFSLMGVDVERVLGDGLLTILAPVPIELCIERLRYDLEEVVRETGAKRLVIDGISDFETSVRDAKLLRDYLTWLVKEFERWGVTALLTSEIEQVTGATRVSEIGCAFLMDAVLYLGFAEIDSVMRRVMSVLKMRNSEHESDLRELLLSPTSACIGDTFAGMSGVMGGTPSGKYHQTVEKVMQPLSFIRGFMTQLIEGEVDPERQKKLLSMMKTQTEKVIAFLCEYYDLDFYKMTGKQE